MTPHEQQMERLKLILNSVTNWALMAFLAFSFLSGKMSESATIVPMLAAAGIETWNRKNGKPGGGGKLPPGVTGAVVASISGILTGII